MIVALLGGFGLAQRLGAEEFLSVLDDMPLMPGLTEQRDQASDFQTPAGRIVEGTATGTVDARAVTSFYDQTLPALGWTREGPGRFVRERERLVIAVAPRSGSVTVRFSLHPQATAAVR
ncbi:MAG: hypothetical protein ACM30I_07125 [Gemmatimonas sp.]